MDGGLYVYKNNSDDFKDGARALAEDGGNGGELFENLDIDLPTVKKEILVKIRESRER